MHKTKFHKPGYLGPAFHEWLEWLEYVECLVIRRKNPAKPRYLRLDEELFQLISDDHEQMMMEDVFEVDAVLATCVRSSVKYRVETTTLFQMLAEYEPELQHIVDNREIRVPHEWSTLVLEEGNGVSYVICVQENTTRNGKDYPELDVVAGEVWLCVNIGFYSSNTNLLVNCPVEMHFKQGNLMEQTPILFSPARGIEVTEKGKEVLTSIGDMVFMWIQSFHLSAMLRTKSVGLPPHHKNFRPKKARKKSKHPKYEHIIMQMPMDHVVTHDGRSVQQSKKRKHQVCGHFRTYKSGKVVWVKPHWRGDAKLGVMRTDFEMTLEGRNAKNER